MRHTQQQQQEDPFMKRPKSPIPPLNYNKVQNKFCIFCNKHIAIQKERISDSDIGKRRFRRVPRNADDEEIHNCRRDINNTLQGEGAN